MLEFFREKWSILAGWYGILAISAVESWGVIEPGDPAFALGVLLALLPIPVMVVVAIYTSPADSERIEAFGNAVEAKLAPWSLKLVFLAWGAIAVLLFPVVRLVTESLTVWMWTAGMLVPVLVAAYAWTTKAMATSMAERWEAGADEFGLSAGYDAIELVPTMSGTFRDRALELRLEFEEGSGRIVVDVGMDRRWNDHELVPRDSIYFRPDQGVPIGGDTGEFARVYGPHAGAFADGLKRRGVVDRLVELESRLAEFRIVDGRVRAAVAETNPAGDVVRKRIEEMIAVAGELDAAVTEE